MATSFSWADDDEPTATNYPCETNDTERPGAATKVEEPWQQVQPKRRNNKPKHQVAQWDLSSTQWDAVPAVRGPKAYQPPVRAPVTAVLARNKTKPNWITNRCTEQHPECMISPTQVCVYAIRKQTFCKFEREERGSCVFGADCMFSHVMPT